MKVTIPLLAGLALAAASSSALAEDLPGDPVIGARLANGWCAECHRDAGAGAGGAPSPGVPRPFPDIARDPATTALRLRVFLQTPHVEMPNYRLSQAEIDHLVSYILDRRRR